MNEGSIDPSVEYVAQLGRTVGAEWPTIKAAKSDAIQLHEQLQKSLRQFSSHDFDIVVFGSLARREWTSGSDVDWTMLVDGQADTQHRVAAKEIEMTLADTKFKGVQLKKPGREGIFGNLAFSHEIVHHIGGEADTNRNTTQRLLLLLEAAALSGSGEKLTPFDRVVRQILNRYLVSDSNFHSGAGNKSRIPRFLLNDVVRYWRTMCVDFAYKDWARGGEGWALRNIKLRTSRKLLFVAGLLMVYSCYENESLAPESADAGNYPILLQEHLLKFVYASPLNLVVWTMTELGLADVCKAFLDCYEEFLVQIDDPEVRTRLGQLTEKEVYSDKVFLKCREITHRLQDTLTSMFFEEDTKLKKFIIEYGVF